MLEKRDFNNESDDHQILKLRFQEDIKEAIKIQTKMVKELQMFNDFI